MVFSRRSNCWSGVSCNKKRSLLIQVTKKVWLQNILSSDHNTPQQCHRTSHAQQADQYEYENRKCGKLDRRERSPHLQLHLLRNLAISVAWVWPPRQTWRAFGCSGLQKESELILKQHLWILVTSSLFDITLEISSLGTIKAVLEVLRASFSTMISGTSASTIFSFSFVFSISLVCSIVGVLLGMSAWSSYIRFFMASLSEAERLKSKVPKSILLNWNAVLSSV